MSGTAFILAALMETLGRDSYHAACTEKLALLFLAAPLLAGAPYLLVQWDKYKRADNARRRAAHKRRVERMARR